MLDRVLDRVIANIEWIVVISLFNLFLFRRIFGGTELYQLIPLPVQIIIMFGLGVAQFAFGDEGDE